jgi:hypothetical protein
LAWRLQLAYVFVKGAFYRSMPSGRLETGHEAASH